MEKSSDQLINQVKFLSDVERLKLVCRANRVLGGSRSESSAEHSWHVALMAVVLSEYAAEPLDFLKVVKMLLVHDLVEIDAGDTWLYSSEQSCRRVKEEAAAERLFGVLPQAQGAEFMALWREFEERNTSEAKFASAMDGIQPLLNHLITGDPGNGVIPVEKVRAKKEFLKQHVPRLWSFVEELIAKSLEKCLYVELK